MAGTSRSFWVKTAGRQETQFENCEDKEMQEQVLKTLSSYYLDLREERCNEVEDVAEF